MNKDNDMPKSREPIVTHYRDGSEEHYYPPTECENDDIPSGLTFDDDDKIEAMEKRIAELETELVQAYGAVRDAKKTLTALTEGAYSCPPVDLWETRHSETIYKASQGNPILEPFPTADDTNLFLRDVRMKGKMMTYRIHCIVNEVEDSFDITADTIEEIQKVAKEELERRGGENPWSEEINSR